MGENKLLFSKHLRLLLHPNGMLLPEVVEIDVKQFIGDYNQ